MTIELDDVESRLADALHRLAEAHVPAGHVTATPPAPRRRWPLLLAAAAVIAVVAAFVATRPDAPDGSLSIDAPTTLVSPASSTTPTVIDTVPSGAIEPTETEPAAGPMVAILDPAIGLGTPYSAGEIDRFMNQPVTVPHIAVRHTPDGSVDGTFIWSRTAVDDVAMLLPGAPEVVLPDGRTVERSEGPLHVTFWMPVGDGVLVAMAPLGDESVLLDWMGTITSADDLERRAPLPGYEWLPEPIDQLGANYLPDDAGGPTAEWASVSTSRFEAPLPLADWIAGQRPGVTVEAIDGGAFLLSPADSPMVVWQPEPTVVVELHAHADRVREFAAGLRFLPVEQAGFVPSSSMLPGVDERDLTWVVLGEATIGRFAYIEGPDRGQACWWWTPTTGGGSSSCGVDGAALQMCSYLTADDTGTAIALLVDRAEARIEFGVDGAPAEGTVERGVATDGTPWLFAWVEGAPATAAGSIPATITVDGVPCEFG